MGQRPICFNYVDLVVSVHDTSATTQLWLKCAANKTEHVLGWMSMIGPPEVHLILPDTAQRPTVHNIAIAHGSAQPS